jgi:hypothetical protein
LLQFLRTKRSRLSQPGPLFFAGEGRNALSKRLILND